MISLIFLSVKAVGNGLVVKFSPAGSLLASGDDKRVVSLRQVETGQHLATLTDHTHWVWAIGNIIHISVIRVDL